MKQYYWFLCVAKVIGPAKLHTVKLDLNGFSCNKKISAKTQIHESYSFCHQSSLVSRKA